MPRATIYGTEEKSLFGSTKNTDKKRENKGSFEAFCVLHANSKITDNKKKKHFLKKLLKPNSNLWHQKLI